MTRKIPAWLERQLADAGRLDTDGYARRARTALCKTCHQPVARGLDDDVMATAVTVDLAPLTPDGELAALLLGRHTHELSWAGARWEINRRDQYRIRSRPPDMNGVHVVVEHECGAQLAHLPPPTPNKPLRPEDDIPPY